MNKYTKTSIFFLDEFGISIFIDYLPGRCAYVYPAIQQVPLLQPAPVSGWQHVGVLQSLKKICWHLILIHDSYTMFSFPWSSFKMHDANTSCLSLVHALDLQHIPSRIHHEHLPAVVLIVPWNDVYKVPRPYLPCSYHMPQEVARYVNGDERDSKSVQWLVGICRNLSKQGNTLDYMCKCTTKVLLFHQLWATLCKAKGIDPWPTMPPVERPFVFLNVVKIGIGHNRKGNIRDSYIYLVACTIVVYHSISHASEAQQPSTTCNYTFINPS